jgi:hypothetical protein
MGATLAAPNDISKIITQNGTKVFAASKILQILLTMRLIICILPPNIISVIK